MHNLWEMFIKKLQKLSIYMLLFVSAVTVLGFSAPDSAHASPKSQATDYCASKNYPETKNKDTHDYSERSACVLGYTTGYNRTDTNKATCHKKVSNDDNNIQFKACKDGYIAGLDARKASSKNQTFNGTDCGTQVKTFFNFQCGTDADRNSGDSDNPIFRIMLTIIAWLTAGVMVAVIGGIVYGGFLYMTAQDNAGQTQKGITIIVDAVIGLIAFGLMWTFLNFIIPGGIYS
ncbi:MAG: pilin [Candidatus Saccharibacteria bacterium]|nr:pilin [Candidatus Saccharibacteria bacterium]